TDKAHFQIMAAVAQKLSEQEVKALSSYLQGLHNKADDIAAEAAAAQPAAAP
ncbi:MAG TPA: cytochrome C, partial [Stenotrophomonas sp.]|nr:cytochrome C [Stenotrophomonas sp.]